MIYCQHNLELDSEGKIFCVLCGADKESLKKERSES